MRGNTKYILILVSVVLLFVVVQLLAPKPIDWTPTYLAKDKNPFGAYVTQELIKPMFKNKINQTNFTLYELLDSIKTGDNIISISNELNLDKESTKVLLKKVGEGSHALLSANYFSGLFKDTLNLNTIDIFFDGIVKPGQGKQDTTDLKFLLPYFKKKGYYYRTENISYFFANTDSLNANAFVISTNAWNKPVTLRIPWGKGYFILNTTPLVFTNNYLLSERNSEYASKTLSFLPIGQTWWTSYYQTGKMEPQSPLRYILSKESLQWAYYLTVIGLALFIFFEAKRRQRIIPIITPLANTTLEFVQTIGNMYLQANDHKAIAEKKIGFFLDQVKTNYFLNAETEDIFAEQLAKKTGNDLPKVQQLFALIKVVKNTKALSKETLLELNQQIETFKL
jgi:hypothetical protein